MKRDVAFIRTDLAGKGLDLPESRSVPKDVGPLVENGSSSCWVRYCFAIVTQSCVIGIDNLTCCIINSYVSDRNVRKLVENLVEIG